MLFSLLPFQDVVAKRQRPTSTLADSVVAKVRDMAKVYVTTVYDYKAKMYVKGKVSVKQKNLFIRYLPKMFKVRRGEQDYLVETFNDLHYSYPDIYDQKIKAFTGTASEFWQGDGRLSDFFHVNIYSSSLLLNKLLSPLAHNGHHYYNYELLGISDSPSGKLYKIAFEPKFKNYQLVQGSMIITEHAWSVREMVYHGSNEMMKFDSRIEMGQVGAREELLPVKYMLKVNFKAMGNKMDAEYTSFMTYDEITINDGVEFKETAPKSKYDLSDSYTLTVDTNAIVLDTTFFNLNRPVSLTESEKQIYSKFFVREDSVSKERVRTHKSKPFWGGMGDLLFHRRTVNMNQLGNLRVYQLLDPMLLGYSHTNGISYKYRIRYNRTFSHDRLLQVTPRIGYNFKYKEFYWRLNANFDYWPSKRASINFETGDGDRIYASKMMQAVNAIPDDMFDKGHIHMDYFKDLYVKAMHSWEITNGLNFQIGLAIHHRRAVKKSRLVIPETGEVASSQEVLQRLATLPQEDAEMFTQIRESYNSFAPRVILEWSPGQYYYMDGRRKQNLSARYPKFIIDYEHSIKGVLHRGLNYQRLEFDIQHDIPLGLMRALFLRTGGGIYTEHSQLYFADFENLRRHNLPDEWGDEIGGVFQLLPRTYYNSSKRYLRGHATYESPFMLLPRLGKFAQFILNERLYLNVLAMPGLHPYWEIGYGLGTHLIDLGFFTSFNKFHHERVGVKATIVLFDK